MNTLTHTQLLAQSGDIKTRWIVSGLVRAGSIGFIAGEPKVTKSFLALHMAQCVATGQPVLGQFGVPVALPVFYLQEEDAVETVMTRYRLLEKGCLIPTVPGGNLTYAIQTGFKLDAPGAGSDLSAAISASGARLVILDVFNRLHSGSDSDQQHMTKVLSVVEKVRRETGAAIMIVHHFAKGSDNKRGNQRMRGSSVLAGWSENSLYLQKGGPVTHVEVENKFAETDNFSYEFVAENEGLRMRYTPSIFDTPTFKTKRAVRLERERRKKKSHVGGR